VRADHLGRGESDPVLDSVQVAGRDDNGRRLPRFEVRCSECGYGATVDVVPDTCPMCRTTAWTRVPPRHASDLKG